MSETGQLRIAVGCDLAGAEVKAAVVEELRAAGLRVLDHSPDPALDYPDVAEIVARAVAEGMVERGVLICGTGIGMSISANKVVGVRAALCVDSYTARMSREHNDANVLCLGGRTLDPERAREILVAWLQPDASNEERHVRRRDKVRSIEQNGLRERSPA
jgi:ribose 5-phosphate isomerase B